MIVIDYDAAPDKAGLFLSGWKQREHDGVMQRTNVKVRGDDGRLKFLWPRYDGEWHPAWTVVEPD